tara:strand:- start:1460 stop:2245 length:786 start_codon:yes stop_codon:yes gene_type:complete
MSYYVLLSLLLISPVFGFLPQFQGKLTQNFEPFYNDDKSKTTIFHTAVLNKVPNYVYSELVSKLNDENLKVIIPSNKLKFKKLEDDLTVIGHSSGSISAIENSRNSKVKRLILIDPIDNRFLNKDEEDEDVIELNNLDFILFIYTKKSYDWSVLPFSFPFVPDKYSLKPNSISLPEGSTKSVIEVSKYGHGDILNKFWADLIHKTIAKGNEKREDVYKYHKWLSYIIKKVAYNDLEDLNDINLKFKNFKLKRKISQDDIEL